MTHAILAFHQLSRTAEICQDPHLCSAINPVQHTSVTEMKGSLLHAEPKKHLAGLSQLSSRFLLGPNQHLIRRLFSLDKEQLQYTVHRVTNLNWQQCASCVHCTNLLNAIIIVSQLFCGVMCLPAQCVGIGIRATCSVFDR